jgi:hypothetical protein
LIEKRSFNRLGMTTDEIQLKRSLHNGRDDGLVGWDWLEGFAERKHRINEKIAASVKYSFALLPQAGNDIRYCGMGFGMGIQSGK